METIQLPIYGITISSDMFHPGRSSISSDLTSGCNLDLVQCMEAIEQIVLCHYLSGVDVTEESYLEGIECAVLNVNGE